MHLDGILERGTLVVGPLLVGVARLVLLELREGQWTGVFGDGLTDLPEAHGRAHADRGEVALVDPRICET